MKNIKSFTLSLAALFGSQFSNAQTNADSYLPVVEKIQTYYNAQDYKNFYELLSSDFKAQQSEKEIQDFLRGSVFAHFGKLNKLSFLKEANRFKHYKSVFDKGDLEMLLACDDNLKIAGFAFRPLVEEKKIKTEKTVSDNKLQTPLDLKIDSVASAFMSNPANCGLSVAVIKNNNTYFYHYGSVEKTAKQLPTNSTIYEIGSLTKTFTGLLLANAIAEKKVSLDDDIRKYLPEQCAKLCYRNISITVKHLLTHTSRIPRIPENIDKQPNFDALNPYKNYDKKMVYEYLSTLKLDTLPGVTLDYSNTGMALLGIILENIYKEPLETLYARYINSPLNMKHTFVNVPSSEMSNFATGYNEEGKATSHWDLGDQVAAGGLKSTITDMANYLEANISEANPGIQNSHQLMFQDKQQAIAYAWFIQPTKKSHNLIWHNGGTYGFSSFCGFIKETKTGVVVLANSGTGVDAVAAELLRSIQ